MECWSSCQDYQDSRWIPGLPARTARILPGIRGAVESSERTLYSNTLSPSVGAPLSSLWWLLRELEAPCKINVQPVTGAGSSRVMIWSPAPVPVICPVEFPAGCHNPWYSLMLILLSLAMNQLRALIQLMLSYVHIHLTLTVNCNYCCSIPYQNCMSKPTFCLLCSNTLTSLYESHLRIGFSTYLGAMPM